MTQRELVKCPHCESTSIFIHQEDDLCLCGECGEAWEQATKAHAVPQWIPVSERLPPVSHDEIVVLAGSIKRIARYLAKNKHEYAFYDAFDEEIKYKVTSWMPLPAAPVKDGE